MQAAERAMEEMTQASEEMQTAAEEMERAALMFQKELPPTMEAMEDASRCSAIEPFVLRICTIVCTISRYSIKCSICIA
jgi:hypothetical protein